MKKIIKCKKCVKTIDDPQKVRENEKRINITDIAGEPALLMVLWQLREMKRQKKYNEKYKTENIYYRFGICKDCLEKRHMIRKAIKAIKGTILDEKW